MKSFEVPIWNSPRVGKTRETHRDMLYWKTKFYFLGVSQRCTWIANLKFTFELTTNLTPRLSLWNSFMLCQIGRFWWWAIWSQRKSKRFCVFLIFVTSTTSGAGVNSFAWCEKFHVECKKCLLSHALLWIVCSFDFAHFDLFHILFDFIHNMH